ncbi:MAG: hypothetical protein ABEI52_10475 [Halobacteriaceae archaeon]
MRAITTFLVMSALFGLAFFIGIATLDPLTQTVQTYDLGGMGSQVNLIKNAVVKYGVPVFLGSVIVWAVTVILRKERQTVR